MPELPEVETARRALRPILVGHRLERVEAKEDNLVFRGLPAKEIESRLTGKTAKDIGRKGKIFWVDFGEPILFIHFGMSGWMEVAAQGESPPKFTKLVLDTGTRSVVFTDPRRLGRIWLADRLQDDPHVRELGFDALEELPAKKELADVVRKRKAPIKAVLLDQGTFAGVGNYLADEVLYQCRIAPARQAADLTDKEVATLRMKLHEILSKAVEVGADEDRFPEDWLFHHRWGGKKGPEKINGKAIVRETIAGRTTAWVPGWQK